MKRDFRQRKCRSRGARKPTSFLHAPWRRAFGAGKSRHAALTHGTDWPDALAYPRGLVAGGSGFDASVLLGPLAASLQGLYDVIPVPLGVIDRAGRHVGANAAYAAIYGLVPADLIGRHVSDYLPDIDTQMREDLADFDAGFDVKEREMACHGRHFLVALQAARDADARVAGVIAVLVDITARKRMEAASEEARRHWQFHASHDYLTGLANRRRLDDTIAAEARRCLRSGAALSVLMMDVDYFKSYNDHVGHQEGDECLRAIAQRLRKGIRRHGDLVGRYGGEEFIAILPDTDGAGAQRVATHLLQDIRGLAMAHPGSPYGYVTLSIGVASLADLPPSKLGAREALLHCADRALYAAKAAGRNTWCVHPPQA